MRIPTNGGTAAPLAYSRPMTPDDAHRHLTQQLALLLGGSDTPHVVSTAISTVVLAGDFAYKLKRPVRLPFLDFSTLAQRHHFLQEELRLNRRTAPALYLDVLPITGSHTAPRLGGPGPAIEWVLRMRRFGPDGDFHARAAAGRLQPEHIDALAAHLAQFHLGLSPSSSLPGGDSASLVAASLDDIAASPRRPATCTPDHITQLRQTLLQRLARQQPGAAQRQAAGWVRECHGDLHLGNLVEWQGQVMAFDALEFDPALRHTDVVADLAFPYMDLLAHGLPALAWRLVNQHVALSGDFEGLRLLADFAACRALVRAKVALLAPGDAATFERCWSLAGRLLEPPRPLLVLCTGLSGSGKSTLALMLAERLGAVRVRSDVERKRLFGLPPTARPDAEQGLYTADATRRTYARLGELAHTLLDGGVSVVVDAACLRQHEREALRGVAQATGAGFALVACEAPGPLLEARIAARQARGDDASDATLAVLHLQQAVAEPVPAAWAGWHHQVPNTGDLAALEHQADALAHTWARRRPQPGDRDAT